MTLIPNFDPSKMCNLKFERLNLKFRMSKASDKKCDI